MVNTYKREIENMHQNLDKSICDNCKSVCEKEGISKKFKPYIGENYRKNKARVLFIGKNARGTCDYQKFAQDQFAGQDRKFAFWSYIKDITDKLEIHPEGVAITNLVKCNNSTEDEGRNNGSSKDFTPHEVKENCIKRNNVIWKEIDILNPTHIVLFTHHYYDKYLKGFICIKNKTVDCGLRKIVWCEGKLILTNGSSSQFLRTSHPQMKKKEDFVNLVSQCILLNK